VATTVSGVAAGKFSYEVDIAADFPVGVYAVCQQFGGAWAEAGTLAVTRRVDLGIDYVLDPTADAASIEVTGLELNWQRDRIMLVGCQDTCGSAGTPRSHFPDGRYQQAWNAFAALPPKTAEAAEAAAADDADDAAAAGNLSSYGVFPVVTEKPEVQRWEPETVACCACGIGPAFDGVGVSGRLPKDCEDPDATAERKAECEAMRQCEKRCPTAIVDNPFDVDLDFAPASARYCDGSKLAAVDILSSAIGASLVEQHRCAAKCPCEGDTCECGGYLAGYDTPETLALCLSRYECEHLCMLLDECHSVDMHQTLDRCFLNSYTCDTHVPQGTEGELGLDEDYTLLVKAGGAAARAPSPGKASTYDWQASQRGHLVGEFEGSAAHVLRFAPVEVEAGTYKVCFCDTELLAAGQTCSDAEDYSVELGKVHVSGVACLLEEPRLRTAACYGQMYGGLSCSADARQPDPAPPEPAPTGVNAMAPPDHGPTP
jgi:hypothetical protein